MAEHRIITTAPALDDLVAELLDEPRYAVDTEFHRERTYYPKVALVQIAWQSGIALVDPLAVSLQPLAKVLAGDGLAIMHAATQDLEVLDLACDTLPTRLFDTQLAAGFLGLSTPSLAALADRELRVRLPKGDRLTDWLARPLRAEQLDYAAADVAHLLELHDLITAQLEALGRREWAEDECEELRAKGRPQRDPEDAWRRIKEVRQLRGNARAVGRQVAAWREARAMQLDLPVRFVLADLAIIAIAQRCPKTIDDLKSLRGLDVRQLGAVQAAERRPTRLAPCGHAGLGVRRSTGERFRYRSQPSRYPRRHRRTAPRRRHQSSGHGLAGRSGRRDSETPGRG